MPSMWICITCEYINVWKLSLYLGCRVAPVGSGRVVQKIGYLNVHIYTIYIYIQYTYIYIFILYIYTI